MRGSSQVINIQELSEYIMNMWFPSYLWGLNLECMDLEPRLGTCNYFCHLHFNDSIFDYTIVFKYTSISQYTTHTNTILSFNIQHRFYLNTYYIHIYGVKMYKFHSRVNISFWINYLHLCVCVCFLQFGTYIKPFNESWFYWLL